MPLKVLAPILFFSLAPLAAALPPGVSLSVKRDLMNPKPPALAPGSFVIGVKDSPLGYVLEDLEKHRSGGVALDLNRRLARPHLRCFWWDGQSLCRNFLWLADTDFGEGPERSLRPETKIVKGTLLSVSNIPSPDSFIQARVVFAPMGAPSSDPPDEALGPHLENLKRRLLEIKKDLEKIDTRELRRGREALVAPLAWAPQTWETNKSPWGLGSLECLGGRSNQLVYRMRLAHADTELSRRESSVAHAYFAYIVEGPGPSLSVMLTLAAFSVWIK